MARIRTVKPEFWIDERVGECSPTARLLFIATWNFADDNGNLERSSRQLKAQAFPYDSFDLEPLLLELIGKGLLEEYEVNSHKYLHISNFEKHQKIEKKSLARHPLPDSSPTPPLPVGSVREGKVIVREEEGEVNGGEIVLKICQAYPNCKYRNEMEIPPIVSNAIIKAWNLEKGQWWLLEQYAKDYADSKPDPKFVMSIEKFFGDPNKYRRVWGNGDNKASKFDEFFGNLGAVSEADDEDGEQLDRLNGRPGLSKGAAAGISKTV